MKEAHRQRIGRHLEEFTAWRASGQTLKTYVEQRGEDITVWRARLTWERRWQQAGINTLACAATSRNPTPALDDARRFCASNDPVVEPSRRWHVQMRAGLGKGTVRYTTNHRATAANTGLKGVWRLP
ncbi:hypothetical protein [Rhodoferax sp.]|uniref:hypothetical protein n=1 Tax=Rhodoferax sp. TaxID=50421 RepID=UPI003BB66C5F